MWYKVWQGEKPPEMFIDGTDASSPRRAAELIAREVYRETKSAEVRLLVVEDPDGELSHYDVEMIPVPTFYARKRVET